MLPAGAAACATAKLGSAVGENGTTPLKFATPEQIPRLWLSKAPWRVYEAPVVMPFVCSS